MSNENEQQKKNVNPPSSTRACIPYNRTSNWMRRRQGKEYAILYTTPLNWVDKLACVEGRHIFVAAFIVRV